jgi:hypothetical protein
MMLNMREDYKMKITIIMTIKQIIKSLIFFCNNTSITDDTFLALYI